MVFKKCCICKVTGSKLYQFPRNNYLRETWLEFILPRCPELINLTKEQLLNRKICINHFEKQYLRGTIRIRNSCPTLLTTDEISTGIPTKPVNLGENLNPDHDYLQTRKRQHIDHTYCKTIKGLQTVTSPYVYRQSSPTKKLVSTTDHAESHNARAGVERLVGCDTDAPNSAWDNNIKERESDSIAETKDTFSWEERTGLVNIQDDPEQPQDDVPDDVSMYCDDDDASLTDKQSNRERWHIGFTCDNCSGDIIGFRYTCVQCSNFDLCVACESSGAHALHYVLRVPGPKPYNEIQTALTRIRRYLMKELDPISVDDLDREDAISLKSEVKSECEDEVVEQVNPLEKDTVSHELIQESRLSSPGYAVMENADFEVAFLNDKSKVSNTDLEQDEVQSYLMELSDDYESVSFSKAERKSIYNTDHLAEKTHVTPSTSLHEINNTTTLFKLEPGEFNPILKLFKLPSSIFLQQGETVTLQSPSSSIQQIICIDGNS